MTRNILFIENLKVGDQFFFDLKDKGRIDIYEKYKGKRLIVREIISMNNGGFLYALCEFPNGMHVSIASKRSINHLNELLVLENEKRKVIKNVSSIELKVPPIEVAFPQIFLTSVGKNIIRGILDN